MWAIGIFSALSLSGCDDDCDAAARGKPQGFTGTVCAGTDCGPDGGAPDGGPDGGGDDDDDDDAPGCYAVSEGTFDLYTVGGISICEDYAPGRCGVAQQGCTVTIDCDYTPLITAEVDADGVTDVQQVPLGDGLVADCHAEFGSGSLALLCDAMGVYCEYYGDWW